ncbi:MAG TPA: aldo/keto reductase, partial [Roseimicrobium sp.]|nr:aldo/keto reductase [Roseimicrobium sp.]
GGRYMHFGEALSEDRFINCIRRAYDRGIRTFMTADVYALGEADTTLGRALEGIPRDTYSLVGIIGHDIYSGKRDGSKGYARFTSADLRQPSEYRDYLMSAAEKQLQRCKVDQFDALLLHNPDSIGYSSDKVWTAFSALKEAKLTKTLGIAPGPANGFALDIIQCFERFAELVDTAMIILNPLEPWPGGMVLPAAKKHDVKIVTRVVDYGGLFHDDVKPGHQFGYGDHRTFRPAGWVEVGSEKIERMRPIAEKHGLTMLQLACLWNLSQTAVQSVIPTLIQEVGPNSKAIETKIDELAAVGTDARLAAFKLSPEEVQQIHSIGNNKGCMDLKGGNPGHNGDPLPDRWSLTPDLEATAKRWGIDPVGDLACSHKAA